ncbi:GGDEF domain-containing protein [Armatimonas rosea]|uniref:Diguanylate cyclase (GGDEF)-like protein n=1 Tax=Armatimonas rosea TaxID=685828 RepID=A0A7W9SRG6_ARMRO|nr:diguanylate cyclase [Armatimonas rosea]MBB6050639.1 diguanylate cyclase (GGDEF)-like protein [Armatimonas rosea]
MSMDLATLLLEGLKCERTNPAQATLLAEQALALCDRLGDPVGRVRALRNRAYAYHASGALEQAETILDNALEQAKDAADPSSLALCLHTKAFFLQKQGELQRALTTYREAALLRQSLGEHALEAGTQNNLGLIYNDLGDYDAGLRAHQRALELWRLTENTYGEAISLKNLGGIYIFFGQYSCALPYLSDSLTLAERLGHPALLCENLLALSQYYRLVHQPERAASFVERAQALLPQFASPTYEAEVLYERACLAALQGEWAVVRQALARTLRILRTLGNRPELARALYTLGTLCLEQGELTAACRSLARCARHAERYGLRSLERNCHEKLTDGWERRQDLGRALSHHRRFHQLDRLLVTEASERQRHHLLQEIELEKVRQHNAALTSAKLELEQTNALLQEQVARDGMTGLFNHTTFQRRFQELFQADGELTLLLIDVDHFKRFNDDFGHPVGDTILKQVAQQLQGLVRESDLLARYGGEEFALALPQTTLAHALTLAERIRSTIAGQPWEPRGVTVSIGAAGRTSETASPAALLCEADQALYAAKRQGRNRCVSAQAL